jgi:hypothetical protein
LGRLGCLVFHSRQQLLQRLSEASFVLGARLGSQALKDGRRTIIGEMLSPTP